MRILYARLLAFVQKLLGRKTSAQSVSARRRQLVVRDTVVAWDDFCAALTPQAMRLLARAARAGGFDSLTFEEQNIVFNLRALLYAITEAAAYHLPALDLAHDVYDDLPPFPTHRLNETVKVPRTWLTS